MAAALFIWIGIAVKRAAVHDCAWRRRSAEALEPNLLLVLLCQLLKVLPASSQQRMQ
jgi:hypothetical protein